MKVFADTSALYAVLDRDDENHEAASSAWERLLAAPAELITTSYVLVELSALVQRRLGMPALRAFGADMQPVLAIEWVTEREHKLGVASMLASASRALSLVDCVSFEVMRRLDLRQTFAFDRDFERAGFDLV